jgi:hypothetical protein
LRRRVLTLIDDVIRILSTPPRELIASS